MKLVVLDFSALIALLRGEPGAAKVQAALDGALVSAVNYTEVVGFLARSGLARTGIVAMLAQLAIEVVPFDLEQAIAAGMLATITSAAGLSTGDRACLALAGRRGARVLTADRAWAKIEKAVGVEIVLIR